MSYKTPISKEVCTILTVGVAEICKEIPSKLRQEWNNELVKYAFELVRNEQAEEQNRFARVKIYQPEHVKQGKCVITVGQAKVIVLQVQRYYKQVFGHVDGLARLKAIITLTHDSRIHALKAMTRKKAIMRPKLLA